MTIPGAITAEQLSPSSEASQSAALDEVVALRAATRAVVRDEGRPLRDRLVALVDLAGIARRAQLPGWAEAVVAKESAEFLELTPPQASLSPDPVEIVCRQLLNKGLIRCPSCARPLPSETELERWRDLRSLAIEEHQRQEAAV
jgi:hypothetical protein